MDSICVHDHVVVSGTFLLFLSGSSWWLILFAFETSTDCSKKKLFSSCMAQMNLLWCKDLRHLCTRSSLIGSPCSGKVPGSSLSLTTGESQYQVGRAVRNEQTAGANWWATFAANSKILESLELQQSPGRVGEGRAVRKWKREKCRVSSLLVRPVLSQFCVDSTTDPFFISN